MVMKQWYVYARNFHKSQFYWLVIEQLSAPVVNMVNADLHKIVVLFE